MFDWRIDEFADLGEFHDRIELALDLLSLHAQNRAVQIDILTARQLGVKSGTDFQQRANPAPYLSSPFGGLRDTREDFQDGALPGPILTNDGCHFAALDRK